jgi:hypothetical protein
MRHSAARWKVTVSSSDDASGISGTGIWNRHNPSGSTITLRSTQPLIEMSTRSISWGSRGSWCLKQTTLPSLCADSLEMWVTQHPGTLRALPGLYRVHFTLLTSNTKFNVLETDSISLQASLYSFGNSLEVWSSFGHTRR